MDQTPIAVGPVPELERIPSLDAVRGFALLGILVMNIQSFSMIIAAYFNPFAYGDMTGLNYGVWYLSHLLADQKFMTIFSILFGAGIVLMAQRAEASGRKPGLLHYHRMLLLILFGAVHAYLLWYGDILVIYGMTGSIVYLFWRRSAITLVMVAFGLLAIGSLLTLATGLSTPHWPEADRQTIIEMLAPSAEAVQAELAAYRGSWWDQMPHRVAQSLEFHTGTYFFWGFWRTGGLFLLGMALFKLGFFQPRRPRRTAAWTIGVALVLGIPAILYGLQRQAAADWDPVYAFFVSGQWNYWASLCVAFGWMGVVFWWGAKTRWQGLIQRLAAVGRMSLSNYILQTLICIAIFYGPGFGLFGRVERIWQLAVVLGIWSVQLTVSPIWLRHFRSGPLEWLWRSIVYGRRQPMVR